jgi:hypothetical protein
MLKTAALDDLLVLCSGLQEVIQFSDKKLWQNVLVA